MIRARRETSMTEKHRELFEKADRILETDLADLFIALIDVFYDCEMKKKTGRAQSSEDS